MRAEPPGGAGDLFVEALNASVGGAELGQQCLDEPAHRENDRRIAGQRLLGANGGDAARDGALIANVAWECSARRCHMVLNITAACDHIVITMKARLVRIGNSRGIRLPKAVIDQVGLYDEVELRVEERRLVIIPVTRARAGWGEAIAAMGVESPSQLDPSTSTRFDETEWRW